MDNNEIDWLKVQNFLNELDMTPEECSTKVTQEDLNNGVRESSGAIYSADGSRLLKGPDILMAYAIKAGTKIIADKAFYQYSNLISITIPDSVTHIGVSAFQNCQSLEYVHLSKNLTHICEKAFYGCIFLHSIDLPQSLSQIGESAFYGCRTLISFSLPKGITHIK